MRLGGAERSASERWAGGWCRAWERRGGEATAPRGGGESRGPNAASREEGGGQAREAVPGPKPPSPGSSPRNRPPTAALGAAADTRASPAPLLPLLAPAASPPLAPLPPPRPHSEAGRVGLREER